MKTPLFSFNHSHVCVPSLALQLIVLQEKNSTKQRRFACCFVARREERQARKMQQELADLLGSASSLLPSSLRSTQPS